MRLDHQRSRAWTSLHGTSAMKYTLHVLALFCLALLVGESAAQDSLPSTGVAKNQAGVNAALLYRQAFAAMPKLTPAERNLLNPASTAPSDASRALVARGEAALKLCAEAN